MNNHNVRMMRITPFDRGRKVLETLRYMIVYHPNRSQLINYWKYVIPSFQAHREKAAF